MPGVNKVTLIGNLGQNPDVRTLNDGKMAVLSVATSESWKDKQTGERRERTEWHRVVTFNEGLVNIIDNYLRKGSKVYVEGTLRTRKWTDQNGQDKYYTEVVLEPFSGVLNMLDSRADHDARGSRNDQSQDQSQGYDDTMPPPNYGEGASMGADLDDEIPF